MDTKHMEERLAAHAAELDEPDAEPVGDPESEEQPPDGPPEPIVETAADVIRQGVGDSRVVVELLKTVGVLVEDGDELVYTLYKPLGPPAAGPDKHRGVKKIRFASVITGYHKRRMAQPHEGTENAVLLTWVEALTTKPRDFIDRLSSIDTDACMAIAHCIEGASKNG